MDKVSPEVRSRTMKAIGRRDTGPEIAVRRVLHRLNYRYRTNDKSLPGSPDIMFRARMKVIFVHGCFWHAHECRKSLTPKSRSDFWLSKLARNKQRDEKNVELLLSKGWDVLVVWECQTNKANLESLTARLTDFLGPSRQHTTIKARSL